MSRSERLLEMVQLLGGRRPRPMREIVEHFGVSERTVYRDLADLQEQHLPLVHEEEGYRLLQSATLRPLNLTAQERAILRIAIDNPALKRRPMLTRRLRTLEAKLDRASRATDETQAALKLAGPDRTGALSDGVLDVVERGVERRRRVELLYSSLSGGTTRWRRVDPYAVFHREGAWYVAGHCHLNEEPRTFRLDRVDEGRVLDQPFTRPADFDLERYLETAWSVFRGSGLYDVVLHFPADLAPLIERSKHHPGEEVEALADGTLEYRVRLSHLDEIARWVVGFGGDVRVVEPEELRARAVELADGTLRSLK